MTYLQKVQG